MILNSFYCPKAVEYNVKFLKGVGTVRAAKLANLGISTAADLIDFYPRTYMDFSGGGCFRDIAIDGSAKVNATVIGLPQKVPTRNRGITLFKVALRDDEDRIGQAVFFNAEYTAGTLEVGKRYCFLGRIEAEGSRYQLISPRFLTLDGTECLLHPVYAQTAGLSSGVISKLVSTALDIFLPFAADPIPDSIRAEHGLCTIEYALRNIHFPRDDAALTEAKNRLVFGELLMFGLAMNRFKGERKTQKSVVIPQCDLDPFYEALPFALTECQRRAVEEALWDMHSGEAMSRLLQGDVGSGKTAVCAALMYCAAKSGFQSALMAPTELLASQHYSTLTGMLSPLGIRTGLLTGSTSAKSRRELLDALRDGEIDILIGTHALFSDDVEYNNLALVVTDEQHRFGVRQRSKLAAKGKSPHFYVMSATPIPRTLALMLYGDLDISVLDTLPGGRREIKTYIYKNESRERLFGFIKKELDAGRQAYIVCPAIEENESGKLAVTTYYDNEIRPAFSSYTTALLHGRMNAATKKSVMGDFVSGKTSLLVSTTVIEVGIDVANATVMVIENADTFGLAQLHQLRGRVGRGTAESYCVLVARDLPDWALKRLEILKNNSDGFDIAEQDLKMRGPGDFLGERQSGLPILRLAGGLSELGAVGAAKNAADKLSAAPTEIITKMLDALTGAIAAGGLN